MSKIGAIGKKNVSQKVLEMYGDEEMEFLVVIGGAPTVRSMCGESTIAHISYIGCESLSDGIIWEGKGNLEWEHTDEEMHSGEYLEYFGKNTIYRVRGRRPRHSEDPKKNTEAYRNRIYVTEILEKNAKSKALTDILERYNKEVAIVSEILGKLILNKEFETYEGSGSWCGQRVRASLVVVDENRVDEGLKLLEQFFVDAQEWDDKMRRVAAEELMELANDCKNDDEEMDGTLEITKEDFAKRIKIEEIYISTDRDFTVYFDDDEMLWGHAVCVYGNVETGISNVHIEDKLLL